jgi:hypothetical protein
MLDQLGCRIAEDSGEYGETADEEEEVEEAWRLPFHARDWTGASDFICQVLPVWQSPFKHFR